MIYVVLKIITAHNGNIKLPQSSKDFNLIISNFYFQQLSHSLIFNEVLTLCPV